MTQHQYNDIEIMIDILTSPTQVSTYLHFLPTVQLAKQLTLLFIPSYERIKTSALRDGSIDCSVLTYWIQSQETFRVYCNIRERILNKNCALKRLLYAPA